MKDLFKDAKFDDKFKTRDGQMAIYIAKHIETNIYDSSKSSVEHTYALKDRCTVHWCKDNGENLSYITDFDIVGKWDEEKKPLEISDIARWLRQQTACGIGDARKYIAELVEAVKHHPVYRTDSTLRLVYEEPDLNQQENDKQ